MVALTTSHNQVVTKEYLTTQEWVTSTASAGLASSSPAATGVSSQFASIQVQSGGSGLPNSLYNLSTNYTTGYFTASSSYTYFYTSDYISNSTADGPAYYEGVEIVLAVFFIILTMATIVGNMMALTVFTRIPVSKTVSVIFFTSMAIADLCTGIFVMPFSVYSLLNKNRVLNGTLLSSDGEDFNNPSMHNYCTFSGVVMNTSTKAALFTLILICFDRFISVHDALHVHLIMTVKNCLLLVIACWVSALLLALFPYIIPDTATVDMTSQRPYKVFNYMYEARFTQCSYRAENVFDVYKIGEHMGHFVYEKESNMYYRNPDYDPTKVVPHPHYVPTAYFFVNILPIVIPTYLIVFFCVAVIVILHRIFKNSKRIIQQIEPPDLKRNRSFRGSVHLTKELRHQLSFKKKANEKPITTQISKVEAGYTEIHMGQGTASEHLEGQVVLRRSTSRKVREVNTHNNNNNNSNKSPNVARDRWSQISVKSLQKRTKADHQKKAINTVILMLMFFVFCYALEWFNIFNTFFLYLGCMKSVVYGLNPAAVSYYCTLTTIMKYLNCAGNPFLYYFRMSQFQKEVRGLTQSWNGTTNNKIQTSGRSNRSKRGYVSLIGKSTSSLKSSRNKSSSSYKYRPSWSCSPTSTSRQISGPASRPVSSHRDSAYRLSDNLSRGSFKHRGSFTSSYKGTPTLRGNSFKRKDGNTPGPSYRTD